MITFGEKRSVARVGAKKPKMGGAIPGTSQRRKSNFFLDVNYCLGNLSFFTRPPPKEKCPRTFFSKAILGGRKVFCKGGKVNTSKDVILNEFPFIYKRSGM